MSATDHVREMLAQALDWEAAHVSFARAVAALPRELQGARPPGFGHSCWELLEHLRLAQADILAFCVDPAYTEPPWPEAYWPAEAAPPGEAAWDASVAAFARDTDALKALALDTARDLTAPLPNGDGQTLCRELLLTADHNAYHLGQLVAVRKALGSWEE